MNKINKRLLVIDDEFGMCELVAEVAEECGFEVARSTNHADFIRLCHEFRPHYIVMDLAMPDMDGFEATRALRARDDTAGLVVVACSAFSQQEMRDRALAAGCDGYITKPIEPRRLVEQVERVALSVQVRRRMSAGLALTQN